MANNNKSKDNTTNETTQNGVSEDMVGYGRPPRYRQFKPGQSGNPAGRPKQRKGLPADLAEELGASIKVTENSRRKTISRQRAILKQLVNRSMTGDLRAISMVLSQIRQWGDPNAVDPLDELLHHFRDIHRRNSSEA